MLKDFVDLGWHCVTRNSDELVSLHYPHDHELMHDFPKRVVLLTVDAGPSSLSISSSLELAPTDVTPFHTPQRPMILDIDPKVDYAFKHLFGRESTRPILVDLLNQVLAPAPGHHIKDVGLLNPFNPKESLDDKLSILDIKARDQMGRQFNVEMQMILKSYFRSRVVYYLAKFHQQQLHEGEDYSALMPTISIVFLNQIQFPDVPDYHLRFRLLEERHHIPYSGDVEVHVLELPKFRKTKWSYPPSWISGFTSCFMPRK
jgi:hypothetical protein